MKSLASGKGRQGMGDRVSRSTLEKGIIIFTLSLFGLFVTSFQGRCSLPMNSATYRFDDFGISSESSEKEVSLLKILE